MNHANGSRIHGMLLAGEAGNHGGISTAIPTVARKVFLAGDQQGARGFFG